MQFIDGNKYQWAYNPAIPVPGEVFVKGSLMHVYPAQDYKLKHTIKALNRKLTTIFLVWFHLSRRLRFEYSVSS